MRRIRNVGFRKNTGDPFLCALDTTRIRARILGSCWAFGAAEAITDRICIESKGSFKPEISADEILACCDTCGEGRVPPLLLLHISF